MTLQNDANALLHKVQQLAALLEESERGMETGKKELVNHLTRAHYETAMDETVRMRDELAAVKEQVTTLSALLTTSISTLDRQKRKLNYLFGHSKKNSLQWMASRKVLQTNQYDIHKYPIAKEAIMHVGNREWPIPPLSSSSKESSSSKKKSKGGRTTRKKAINRESDNQRTR